MSGISALKGYRTQFIYSLYHILKENSPTSSFLLEGVEDLDQYDGNGQLTEVIQVKNLNKPLGLSDLISKEGTSFVRRFLNIIYTSPSTNAILITYSQAGEELERLMKSANIGSKDKPIIRKYGITEKEWAEFKARTTIIKVEEEQLKNNILQQLKNIWATVDPEPTAELLLQWLANCAEKQVVINHLMLHKKVESIAMYLTERIAISAQLGKYLMPLILESPADVSKLSEEFYQGVSARFEHINLNLDVHRPQLLSDIDLIYQTNNIAVLFGASGQGKSTLAYRYIKENSASTLAYELHVVDDNETTREAVLTIGSIAKNLGLPVTILINVPPNNLSWMSVVSQSAHLNFIRFLITIRQEDWFKSQAAGINFLHQPIELSFHKIEAAEIYSRLNHKITDLKHIDFEEAWIQFQGAGPLLEFVYMVTQGAPLRNRLQQQVAALQKEADHYPEALEVLRLVALADAFGAGLDIQQLRTISGLYAITARLEKEFLLKVSSDQKIITGFHPLRSKLLLDFLFDEFIIEKRAYVCNLLKVVTAAETYVFLLNIFHENIIDPTFLIQELRESPVDYSWTKYHGIVRALLWSGLRKYVANNSRIFEEYYDKHKDGWYILLDIYFGNTLNHEQLLGNLQFPEEVRQKSREANKLLIKKTAIFDDTVKFVDSVRPPMTQPISGNDAAGYGGMLFWVSQFDRTSVMPVYEGDLLSKWSEQATTEQMATLMLGLYTAAGAWEECREKLESSFFTKIRRSHAITDLTITDDQITAIYLVDILSEESFTALNDRSYEIAELLRRAVPTKELYAIRAMGHHLDSIPMMNDDSVKNMPIKNIHLSEWTGMNYTLKNLFENRYRPKDWSDYLAKLSQWESQATEKVNLFSTLLTKFMNGKGDWEIIAPLTSNQITGFEAFISAPASIQDPLALHIPEKKFVKNTTATKPLDRSEKIGRLQLKFKDFNKSLNDYKSHIETFLTQSSTAIYERARQLLDPNNAENENNVRLSQYNLQEALKSVSIYHEKRQQYFSKYVEVKTPEVSRADLFQIMLLWRNFLSRTGKKKTPAVTIKQVEQIKDDLISRAIKTFRNYSKDQNFRITFKMDNDTGGKPVIFLDSDHTVVSLDALNRVYNLLPELFTAEAGSLKQLILENFYDPLFIFSTVQGHTINSGWYQIPLYKLQKKFNDLNLFDLVPKPIDASLFAKLNLVDWSVLIPKINQLQVSIGELMQVQLLVQQLKDVAGLQSDEMDEMKEKLLQSNFNEAAQRIAVGFQKILDDLAFILEDVGYDQELYKIDLPETEFIDAFLAIKDNLYPENGSGGDSQSLRFNLQDTIAWVPRLQICHEKLSTIFFLVVQKYIDAYNEEQAIALYPHLKAKTLREISDFFQLDFTGIPDISCHKGKTEINKSGSRLTNYYKKLTTRECAIFDAANIILFAPRSYNIIFEGLIDTPMKLVMLKWLINQFTRLNGVDSLDYGKMTSDEMMDVMAGRFWTGRMWTKNEGSKLPDMMIRAEKNKVFLTIFSPIK
ncbi:hypothetical protein SNE26_07685 [Mucilaginibacter sp. cycad4]|uniref:hypothetical protein n=1 Tax=Mucilaginibacter sp. cycad4 TaxID=3342096 RepID=UPI002AAC0952|nr:hypothetical protein [Mucilaginibacter gossypii]WPV01653.1 hypothetical protein SNE26_07685 [Mucilaginibacter gossypii]